MHSTSTEIIRWVVYIDRLLRMHTSSSLTIILKYEVLFSAKIQAGECTTADLQYSTPIPAPLSP